MPRPAHRLLAAPLALLLGLAAMVGLAAPPAVAGPGGGDLSVIASLQDTGTGTDLSLPVTRPAGWGYLLRLTYSCLADTCFDGVITVELPTGATPGQVGYPPEHVQGSSYDPATRTLTITMQPAVAPASGGAITVPITAPAWSQPSGTTQAVQVKKATDQATPTTVASLGYTLTADNTTATAGAVMVAGLLGESTVYTVGGCISAPVGTTVGPLGIASGSRTVVALPPQATYVSSNGFGVYDALAHTITWTAGTLLGGCLEYAFTVTYDSPTTSAGDQRSFVLTWTGHDIGQTSDDDRALDDPRTVTSTVPAPVFGATVGKYPSVAQRAATELLSYLYNVSNTGTVPWTDVEIEDTVDPALDVTAISVDNGASGETGTLWVTTAWGADGVSGTADDDEEFLVATVAARGSRSVAPRTAWPGGSGAALSAMAAGDAIVGFRFVTGTVARGSTLNMVGLATAVLETDRDGVAVVPDRVIATTAHFTFATDYDAAPVAKTSTGPVTVVPPSLSAAVFPITPGTLASGVKQGTFGFEIVNLSTFRIPRPVAVVVMPPGVTLDLTTVAYAGNGGLPAATVTVVQDWKVEGQTLYRFTVPSGQLAQSKSWKMTATGTLDETAYGQLKMAVYLSSVTTPVNVDSVWDPQDQIPDTSDIDADGDVTEGVQRKLGSFGPQAVTSVSASQSIKGSWDSAYAVGPATGYTAPGSVDNLRFTVKNTGTVELHQAVVIAPLPRPGDANVLNSGQRNPATGTFPVVLSGRPEIPAGLTGVVTSWTTVADPCRAELGWSPTGCQAPAWTSWDTTAPPSLAAVTAVKLDFGANLLKPGRSWVVTLPVTTPTTGASEPDFAAANPDPDAPEDDEVAYASSGYILKEVGAGYLNASSTPAVTLRMPSRFGGPTSLPPEDDLTTTGPAGTAQQVDPVLGTGWELELLDEDDDPVTSWTVPGVGTYQLVGGTTLKFTPVDGYAGTPTGGQVARYRVTNPNGSTTSTYTPTVGLPDPPEPTAVTAGPAGEPGVPQSVTVTPPTGGSVHLLDPDTGDPVTSVTVPEGVWTVNPVTGKIQFTPDPDVLPGPVTGVGYRVTDRHDQTGDSTAGATVVWPDEPAPAAVTGPGGNPGAGQTFTIAPPTGGSVHLLDPDTGDPVTSVTLPGVGTYGIDPATGAVTFAPEPGYLGTTPAVGYRVTDAYGQTGDSTLTTSVSQPPPVVDGPGAGGGAVGVTSAVTAARFPGRTGVAAHRAGARLGSTGADAAAALVIAMSLVGAGALALTGRRLARR